MSGSLVAPEFSHPQYRDALLALERSGIPFLVGGAYALQHYTGAWRDTNDLDLFVLPDSVEPFLRALDAAGWRSELLDPIWLGKGYRGDLFIDVIFNSRNGIARVDERWFRHAEHGEVLGVPVPVIPVEEMIWSKAYVQERHRYDGADINHLLRVRADRLDWRRLLERFSCSFEVLAAHLLNFAWVYPSERARVPRWVWTRAGRATAALSRAVPDGPPVCRGTLLSMYSYQSDIEEWGFRDALELTRRDGGAACAPRPAAAADRGDR